MHDLFKRSNELLTRHMGFDSHNKHVLHPAPGHKPD